MEGRGGEGKGRGAAQPITVVEKGSLLTRLNSPDEATKPRN